MYITIDARLINASGIGTYITKLVPLIIQRLNNIEFFILGKKDDLATLEVLNYPNTEFIQYDAPIYTVKEQLIFPKVIPKKTNLFWAPHYNIPIYYSGNLLVTIHDLAHLVLYQSSLDFIKKRYARYFFKKILQKADKIITVSNFSKNEYTKYFGLEKDFKQIVAIHNGISINKNIYSNPYNRPYILTVGNIKPHKNLSRLLDAFNKIMDSIPHTLLIVGKKSGFIGGDMNLIKKANAFGERVVMTGFLSDDKLQSYYSHADAFIFPSIYEGFGFPPLEAMAAGIPVIASKAASITEVCGDAALYFDPYNIDEMAENILQMVNDQTLGNLYISKGKKRVKMFSWGTTAEKTIQVINNILHD